MPDVVVIGGGLSGLACAWELGRRGRSVVVLERETAPGGVVRTRRIDGFMVEAGPNSILPTTGAAAMLREAGLDGELVMAPPGLGRFVLVGGRLRKVPWVLSAGGALRALAEPLVRSRAQAADESLADFFTRRFGHEVHDRLIAPFVGGIYAGDTRELGVEGTFPRVLAFEREFGSVLMGFLRSPRGPRPRLCSFREGMAALPRGLARGLDVRGGTEAVSVSAGGRLGWRVTSAEAELEARSVVLAVPAHAAADCFSDPELGDLLRQVAYAPVMVAAAALDVRQAASVPRGFGFLVPPAEGLSILGTLFSSSVFPDRAPAGKVLLTTFLGGSLMPESVGWTDERVWKTLEVDLGRVLRFSDSLLPLGLYRYARGIPQYRTGHPAWRRRVRDRLSELPGLFLTGNYLDGVSVPMTLEHGRETAGAVVGYLEERQ